MSQTSAFMPLFDSLIILCMDYLRNVSYLLLDEKKAIYYILCSEIKNKQNRKTNLTQS